jgi:hypothetical protein
MAAFRLGKGLTSRRCQAVSKEARAHHHVAAEDAVDAIQSREELNRAFTRRMPMTENQERPRRSVLGSVLVIGMATACLIALFLFIGFGGFGYVD